jgi:membrane protease YdiL (CAAX protease family)
VTPGPIRGLAGDDTDNAPVSPVNPRTLKLEVLVVLSIFPLSYVAVAIADATLQLVDRSPSPRIELIDPARPELSLALELLLFVSTFGPFFLVTYLLHRSDESLSSIGLDFRRPWRQVGVGIQYTVAFFLLAGLTEQLIARSGLPFNFHYPIGSRIPGLFVAYGILRGIRAGLIEETVVLGYLVHRLEQLGWSTRYASVASVTVRASYHVYYGTGVLSVIAFGAVVTWVYVVRRKLLALIVGHGLYDALLYTADILRR